MDFDKEILLMHTCGYSVKRLLKIFQNVLLMNFFIFKFLRVIFL